MIYSEQMSKTTAFPIAISINIAIALTALLFSWIFNGPWMDIEKISAQIISFVFFAGFLFVVFWEKITKYHQKERGIAISGPYKFVRHPIIFAIVFLLNPAVAFLFRSWILILATIPLYFIWKNSAKYIELAHAKEFGNDYRDYRLKVPMLFPKFNKLKFFSFILFGLLIAIIIFVFLNFESLYFRYVIWKPVEINTFNLPQNTNSQKLPFMEKMVFYDEPNSIVIEKLGINAPLVFVQSDSQKELNSALNNGVVVYPGSVKPGETGNLFITGHSSAYPWNKTQFGKTFSTLDKLEAGDIVIIYYNNRKYEYRIENEFVAYPKDVKLVHPNDYSKITLFTCWPLGTNLKRLVVEGRLIN